MVAKYDNLDNQLQNVQFQYYKYLNLDFNKWQ